MADKVKYDPKSGKYKLVSTGEEEMAYEVKYDPNSGKYEVESFKISGSNCVRITVKEKMGEDSKLTDGGETNEKTGEDGKLINAGETETVEMKKSSYIFWTICEFLLPIALLVITVAVLLNHYHSDPSQFDLFGAIAFLLFVSTFSVCFFVFAIYGLIEDRKKRRGVWHAEEETEKKDETNDVVKAIALSVLVFGVIIFFFLIIFPILLAIRKSM